MGQQGMHTTVGFAKCKFIIHAEMTKKNILDFKTNSFLPYHNTVDAKIYILPMLKSAKHEETKCKSY